MIIYVDIDETVLHSPDSPDYRISYPIQDNIDKINKLYDMGHIIIYWTARGTKTKIDWSQHTIKQFNQFGIKYHEIKFGKPNYDLFIDDKNINTTELNKIFFLIQDEYSKTT